MFFIFIFVYMLSIPPLIIWAYPEVSFEFVAYSDDPELLNNLLYSSYSSYSSYWEDLMAKAFERPINCSYIECTPLTSSSVTTYDTFAYYGVDLPLGVIIPVKLSFYNNPQNYSSFKQQLNQFDPNSIQTYLADYIPATIEFQVLSGTYTDDRDTMPYYDFDASYGATQGQSGEHAFDWSECIVSNPAAVWLSISCHALFRWNTTDVTWNNGWYWSDIFADYILLNVDQENGYTTNSYREVSPYTDDREVTLYINFDYGYATYIDFEADYEYNNNDMSEKGIEDSFYSNYPPVADGEVDDVMFECDRVMIICDDEDETYCTFTFPWENQCDYTNSDTTTTTDNPSNTSIDCPWRIFACVSLFVWFHLI